MLCSALCQYYQAVVHIYMCAPLRDRERLVPLHIIYHRQNDQPTNSIKIPVDEGSTRSTTAAVFLQPGSGAGGGGLRARKRFVKITTRTEQVSIVQEAARKPLRTRRSEYTQSTPAIVHLAHGVPPEHFLLLAAHWLHVRRRALVGSLCCVVSLSAIVEILEGGRDEGTHIWFAGTAHFGTRMYNKKARSLTAWSLIC